MLDLKVLYAEDEEPIRNILTRVLGKLVKEVVTAADGEEALELYHSEHPDIIITDIKMPRMTGFEMAEIVRKENKIIPIIAATAHNEVEHFLDAIRLGITSFLVKPIEVIRLGEVLASANELVKLQKDNLQKTTLLEHYKAAVDVSNLVSKTDKNGIITYVNDQFCNALGYTKEELIGKYHNIIRHPDMPTALFKNMWETISSKKIWRHIMKNLSKSGATFYMDTTIVPVTSASGEIEEFIAIRTDITALENALLQAKLAEKAKGDFLAAMSHEIRTPLNAILGFTSLLKDVKNKSVRDEYIAIIESSGKNLLAIINDILDYSKIENGSFEIDNTEFEPLGELESCVELFVIKAYEKHIRLLSFIDPKIPARLVGDPLRIKQIVLNLLSNAIKFTPEYKKITVNMRLIDIVDNKAKILFEVADEGIGIPENKIQKIFTPFSQADAGTSRQYGGTGLGLSISSNLVSMMGSKISVESQEGKGSRFWFELLMPVVDPTPSVLKTDIKKANLTHLKDFENIDLIGKYLKSIGVEVVNTEDSETGVFLCMKDMDSVNCTHAIIVSDNPFYGGDELVDKKILRFPLIPSKIKAAMSLLQKNEKLDIENSKAIGNDGIKVLVAEDNVVNQKLIAALLKKHGAVAVIASNGAEAVDIFDTEPFKLVLLDIHMPIVDGVEAMKLIKQKTYGKDAMVVALTAEAISGDKERFLASGFDGYLEKPIEEQALLMVLKDCFSEQNETSYFEALEVALGIDKEFVVVLLKDFVNDAMADIKEMNAAIESRNTRDVFELAHKIKGAAANLRLADIKELALAIEKNARDGVSDFDYALFSKKLADAILKIHLEDLE